MNAPVIECVPNFSEGRRREVVDAIVSAIAAVPGIRVLDLHLDPNHNRSVVTFTGPEEEVSEAARAGARVASERIDLNRHRGEHPRVGALDVLPFVPLGTVPMTTGARIARRVAAEISTELGVPAYLYESAVLGAPRPLEQIRKLGFERLREEIASREELRPDFGPRQLHPTAGAVFVGARKPLVAFNVDLETGDLAVARRIARAVREASGGLPAVKALGLVMASTGLAQVSMNLTDYEKTSMAAAFFAVRELAGREGVGIRGSELVGLAPRAALAGANPAELGLTGSARSPILEDRLAEAGLDPPA